jgi:hypothetical protein
VLFLHETHQVVGRCEHEFEASVRDDWMPALAAGGGARLLYFLHHAHGTGASYNVITLTALRDGAAWQGLVDRVNGGDLEKLAVRLDELRRDVTAKLLVPLPWSLLQRVDLDAVPAAPGDHEPAVFMEDTVWPHEGRLEEYVERSGSHYAREMARQREKGRALLEIQAAFRTAYGSGRRREIVLWQKVTRLDALGALVASEVPAKLEAPGTWMHDALEIRDQWQSRLLRSARWSPWS